MVFVTPKEKVTKKRVRIGAFLDKSDKNLGIIFLTHSGSSYQCPAGKDLRQQGHIRLIRPISGSFSTSGRKGHSNPICNHDCFFDRKFCEFSEIEDYLTSCR